MDEKIPSGSTWLAGEHLPLSLGWFSQLAIYDYMPWNPIINHHQPRLEPYDSPSFTIIHHHSLTIIHHHSPLFTIIHSETPLSESPYVLIMTPSDGKRDVRRSFGVTGSKVVRVRLPHRWSDQSPGKLSWPSPNIGVDGGLLGMIRGSGLSKIIWYPYLK